MKSRLPARAYYGVIAAGVLLGAAAAALSAWWAFAAGAGRPTGRNGWDDVAAVLLFPIAVMVGATFGGLLGVAVAVVWDKRRSSASGAA